MWGGMSGKAIDIRAVNSEELLEVRALLSGRFSTISQHFLEDAARYVLQVREGVAGGNLGKVIQSAHPLKSSSAGFGFAGLAAMASIIEDIARNAEKEGTGTDDLVAELASLDTALQHASNYLRQLLQNGHNQGDSKTA